MTPTVLCDVDGVIANFTQLYVSAAKAAGVLPENFSSDWQPETWQISKSLGLTRNGIAATHRVLDSPAAASMVNAYPGAVQGVKKLAGASNLYFVTSPVDTNPTWCFDRRNWLIKLFGHELGEKVIFTGHKHMVRGDILIDDKIDNLEGWQKAWPKGIALCWSQKYNQKWHGARASDWDQAMRYLQHSKRNT